MEPIGDAVHVAELSQASSILELGCGPKTATASCAELGCRMICIEPYPAFLR